MVFALFTFFCNIENAKDALLTILNSVDLNFVDLKNHHFFAFGSKCGVWVGSNGTASFEFVDKETVINKIR